VFAKNDWNSRNEMRGKELPGNKSNLKTTQRQTTTRGGKRIVEQKVSESVFLFSILYLIPESRVFMACC